MSTAHPPSSLGRVRFPRPLAAGDLIAVTAPSSGVSGAALDRLDLVIAGLRARGYRVVEGRCLRAQYKDASAPRRERAQELLRFLHDPAVSAILPPWGGELASELLEDIDFQALRAVPPKWLMGFSDLSTLMLPLTLIAGWATAHGPNLMDLVHTQTDPLTTGSLRLLESDWAQPIVQRSSALFQKQWVDFAERVDAPLHLTEPTEWRRLDGASDALSFQGRLIGGCLDTIAWLAGTPYGDIPGFAAQAEPDGVVLYLENVEMAPPGLVRALLALKRHRWFDGLSGLLIGRSAGPVPASADRLDYAEALRTALADLACPVLYDVDIGHQPPQFTLINGAWAEVSYAQGRGSLTQLLR